MIPKQNLARAIKKAVRQPGYAAANLLKRTKAHLHYQLFNGKSTWPETISLFLTYNCNLRCKMCGQWGDKGVFHDFSKELLAQRLSLETIEKLVQDVAFFKPNITLFGGEPFIHPEWKEIIAIIKSKGLRCNIITNGTFLKKYANEIIESGIDEIIFSLDGSDKIHDEIRGIPGTFSRALEGFEEINRIKKEKRLKKPLININSTLFEDNHEFIMDTVEAAKLFQPSGLTFHHLLFLPKPEVGQFCQFFNDKFGQTPVDWFGFSVDSLPDIKTDTIIEAIHKIKSQKNKFDISFYPNFTIEEVEKWYGGFEFQATSYKNRCMSLWMTAYVFPDGAVRPYHSMNYDLGNIKNTTFTKIWNNSMFRDYRNYIKQHKQFPVCSKGCTEFFRY